MIFIIVSVFFFIGFGKIFVESLKRKKWSITKGVIITLEVKVVGNNFDDSGWRKVTTYKYKVKEKEYVSSNVNDGLKFHSPDSSLAKDLSQKKYRPEALVDVFYNPKKPTESILENKLHPSVFILLIISLVFLLIGLFSEDS